MPYFKSSEFSVWNILPEVTLSDNERQLRDFLKKFPEASTIVDIGAGGRYLSDRIITFDKYISENIMVLGDIHDLPFQDSSLDCIICTGTLEHIEDPKQAIQEFSRVLKLGGYCYISTPFMQGYHPDPTDYWRFTLEGLQMLFKDFQILEKGIAAGSGSGLSWALIDFFKAFSCNHYLSEFLGMCARFFFFWVKYFDFALRKKDNNKLFASAYYIICKKV